MERTFKKYKFRLIFFITLIFIYSCDHKENERNNDLLKVHEKVIEFNGKKLVNQRKVYNQDGSLDTVRSKFFNILIDDTLYVGPNLGKAQLYTYNKSYKFRNSAVILENYYPKDSISKDTFYGNPENLKFGIYFSDTGNKKIVGKIEEVIGTTTEKDSVNILEVTSYFKKNVFVKDTVE